nr:hypothetical protein CFP56_21586 [Quercus suber]
MAFRTADYRILTALRMFARTGQATRAAPMSHDWSCGTQLGKSPDRGMLRHQPRPDRVTSNHSSRCLRTKAGSRLLQYYVPHRNHVRLLFPLSLEHGVEDKAVLEDLKALHESFVPEP